MGILTKVWGDSPLEKQFSKTRCDCRRQEIIYAIFSTSISPSLTPFVYPSLCLTTHPLIIFGSYEVF